jgi:hypothetical protein
MTDEQITSKEERRMFFEMFKKQCFVDLNKRVDLPPIAIGCGSYTSQNSLGLKKVDIPLCTYGNFSFIQAPPKSLKTFFVSLLTSTYVSNTCEYRGQLKSFRKDEHIVHFDTEQGMYHSQKVMKRTQRMNPSVDVSKFYHTYALREIGFKSRIEFIEACLEDLREDGKKIGLVIIDGIADLVSEANNQIESNEIVQKLMTWTTVFNCHIITVIHSNFGSDKPTGHLGSFLEKKTETQIELKFDSMTGKTMVSCKRSRNIPFKEFFFYLDDKTLPKFYE